MRCDEIKTFQKWNAARTECGDDRGRSVDVEEGDVGAGEVAEGPAQQGQRLLRRPPDGDVDPRVDVVAADRRVERPAAVQKRIHGKAGAGARRRRRAQDLHR